MPLAAKAGIVLSVPLGNRLVLIAHLVVGIVGCLLLYVALFLHETEQGELQNRLEKLWIDIDDLSKSALSKQIAFLQQVSALVTSGLDKLSGKKLLSFAAVATSFCFSVSSVSVFWAYFISHIQDHFGEQPTDTNSVAYQSLILIIVAILTVLLGLFPLPFRYLAFIWTPLLFMLAISYDFDYGGFDWSMLDWKDFSMEGMLGPALVTLGGGFVSDILFIATSRWCFRKTAKLNSGWKIVCLLVLRSSIGCVLIAPLFWGIQTLMKNRTLLDWQIAVEMLGGFKPCGCERLIPIPVAGTGRCNPFSRLAHSGKADLLSSTVRVRTGAQTSCGDRSYLPSVCLAAQSIRANPN